MRKSIIIIALLFLSIVGFGQNPVRWSITSRKVADKTYEVCFRASIEQPWHIYAMDNSKDVSLPTTFNFKNHPLLIISEPIKEKGEMISEKDDVSGVMIKYYTNQVDFIQTIKVKSNAKTNIEGTIDYMACTEGRCLPPVIENFNLVLN